MKIVCLAAWCVLAASAQIIGPAPRGPGLPISPDLRVYLDLTGDQMAAMNRLTAELRRFQSDKARRAAQVQLELQDQRQKETLDPMAFGLRYVELEAIQRDVAAKSKDTAAEVQKLFTPAQRTKLQALVDVLHNYPLACEAVSLNLITPDTRWFNTGAILTGTAGRLIYGSPYIGCNGVTFSRTGDIQP